MAEEDTGLVHYKDISELKRNLEGIKGKKDVSAKALHEAVSKLTTTMNGIIEVFGAAAEQLKLEDKEFQSDAKKHETMINKLDKLLDQNKTIAEGMVAVVEMVKERLGTQESEKEELFKSKEDDAPLFKPKEPEPLPRPSQPEFKPTPQPIAQPSFVPSSPDLGTQMPPMQPAPAPDLDFPEEPLPLGEEPKKKGLFGRFKK
ncbi:hypothetical protein CMO83_04380 [Candidatus Woesearchaeota archaeon]|jgi:hypothetical protein|nr:hypothetical protein [Candidatus Woesearchaeota archaeon]|tara:strand:- start:10115 stop:10720 length:606 start_codon:yes stop_codon:yes gene_type:complete